MNKKILIWVLMLILLVSSVVADPPFLQTTESTLEPSLKIAYPKFNYFPYGENLDLNFHIFNNDNQLLTNDTINCTFHFYNKTGNHLIETNLDFDSNNIDFFIDINTSILSYKGYYSYIVQCNSSGYGQEGFNQSGFLSTNFEVTTTGKAEVKDTFTSFGVLLFLLMINVTLYVLALKGEFTGIPFTDLVLKRCFLILALFITGFNTSIVWSLSAQAGLNMLGAFEFYLWIFTFGGYLACLITFVKTIFDMVKLGQKQNKQKRMGEL